MHPPIYSRMKKLLLLLLVYFTVHGFIYAQDPHFSQFFSSPLTLNPAFTGKFNGKVRLAGNFRNQWPTINRAYQTITGSIDFPILQNTVGETDRLGIGFMGFSDKSAAGAVNFNFFSASAAFHKALDEDGYQQIGTGFQVTYSNMLINTSVLKFEDQLTPFGFTNPTSEVFNNSTLRSNYIDLNAGLLYTASTQDRNNFYGGVSLYHINRPKQQFTGVGYELNPRATFHAGGYVPISVNATLHFNGLYSTQAGAHEALIGGAAQFFTGDPEAPNPTSFYGGGWIRFGDALIPFIGIEFSGLRIGATYDINTSSLKTASEGRGGVEFSLIYILQQPESKTIPCPKF